MTGTYGIGRDSTTAVSDFISGIMYHGFKT